jgi:WD40 repeat protein
MIIALPVHILPNETTKNDPSKSHTMDILSVVYLPPAYIATAGLDGKILLWSLNSGEFISKLYESPVEQEAIEAMVYVPKLEMIFASGESRNLICIERSIQLQAIVPLDHKESITSLCVDKSNTHLISGDASGMVKLWDLSISNDHDGIELNAIGQWQIAISSTITAMGESKRSKTNDSVTCSSSRIVCLEFIEHFRFDELFILVSCGNGEVSIWTLDGVCVGIFGNQHQTWQLGNQLTYLTSVPELIALPTTGTPLPHLIKCVSITSLSNNHNNNIMSCNANADTNIFLLEDSIPKAGEVWICLSAHRARAIMNGSSRKTQQQNDISSTTNNHHPHETLSNMKYLHQRLMENSTDVLDVITVIKIARGEVSYPKK